VRRLAPFLLAGLLWGSGVALAQEPAAPEHTAAEHEAGEHGEHGIDPKTLAFQLINFGVLVTILVVFGGKAINKTLKARYDQLKTDMDEAARVRAAAEARFKEQQQRLDNLEQEIAAMRQAIAREAEQEKARILAAAEEKAKRIVSETKFQLEQLVKEAEHRFQNEVAAAAMKIANDILRRSVTGSDEQRLTQGFVNDLAASRPAADGGRRPRPTEETVS
jgi:F-type H+-transporting ATPase subunit b